MTHEQKECLNRNHWLNKKSVSISEPCEPSESHPNASETLLEPSAWFWVWDGFKRLWDGCRRLSDVSEMVSGGSRMVSASLFPGRIFQNAVETPHRLEINPHSMMVVTHCCHIKFTRNPTSLGPQHFRGGDIATKSMRLGLPLVGTQVAPSPLQITVCTAHRFAPTRK